MLKNYIITHEDAVYISGPMTGLPGHNRAAFFAAEKLLQKRYGCRVLNPANMPDGYTYRDYMANALWLLTKATCVVLLPGHANSLGVQIEICCARRDKLPVLTLEDL